MNKTDLFYPDNIGEYKLGKVVRRKEFTSAQPFYTIGHIVGFKINNLNEVIVNVQWASYENYAYTTSISISNLELL